MRYKQPQDYIIHIYIYNTSYYTHIIYYLNSRIVPRSLLKFANIMTTHGIIIKIEFHKSEYYIIIIYSLTVYWFIKLVPYEI